MQVFPCFTIDKDCIEKLFGEDVPLPIIVTIVRIIEDLYMEMS